MKLHETWLIKSRNDLKSSRKLIEGEDAVLDTSIYHTQQCAEKALKAYLAFKKHPVEKTHDVEYVIELCSDYNPEFENLIEDAEKLNPYSTLYRYPGVLLEPEEEDVREAIQVAEKILKFVEKEIELLERNKKQGNQQKDTNEHKNAEDG
jgi:HEPN domain-containing protein